MDKKIFENMRHQLSPDDSLIAKVLEKTEDSRMSVKETEITERKAGYKSGCYVRKGFGIAAALTAAAASFSAVLIYVNTKNVKPSSSAEAVSGADVISESSLSAVSDPESLTETDSSQAEKMTMPSNNFVIGSGQYARVISKFSVDSGALREYAALLEKVCAEVGKNVNVYNMTVPLASAFYLPDDLDYGIIDQKAAIDELEGYFDYVKNVDAYSALDYHKAEDLYFYSDIHWKPIGAYYAMANFFSASRRDYQSDSHQGKVYLNLNDYTLKVIDGFRGNLSGAGDEITNYQFHVMDEIEYYVPPVECKVTYRNSTFTRKTGTSNSLFDLSQEYGYKYSIQMGAMEGIAEVETNTKNGRVLVIADDSFGNAAVPFLVNNFERIYLVNTYTADIDLIEFVGKVGATDVLFLNSLENCGSSEFVYIMQEHFRIGGLSDNRQTSEAADASAS